MIETWAEFRAKETERRDAARREYLDRVAAAHPDSIAGAAALIEMDRVLLMRMIKYFEFDWPRKPKAARVEKAAKARKPKAAHLGLTPRQQEDYKTLRKNGYSIARAIAIVTAPPVKITVRKVSE